nr:uncharacterized protein LOC111428651 [Onthophagus taurus]
MAISALRWSSGWKSCRNQKACQQRSYYNYKHTFSVVLLATVDADYKFITVDVGAMGRFGDANLFSSSASAQLPTIVNLVSYVFVGDEAFPLSENLIRPYPRRYLTGNYAHQVFNARLSRARQTVECAFGALASRFRVFRRPFESKIDTVTDVVQAACVLHNYLRSSVQITNDNVDDIERFLDNQLVAVRGSNVRNTSKAFKVREQFTEYFNNWGALPWQLQTVILGN